MFSHHIQLSYVRCDFKMYRSVLPLCATEQTGIQSLLKFIALDINGDFSELSSEKNHCCYFLAAFISRYFCLLLETHKSLFSEDTKFRISVNDVDEYNKYDTRTAYKGTVEGK